MRSGKEGFQRRKELQLQPAFAANLKTGPVISTKGYLGLDRYDSEASRTEQHAGCILKRILVWLMDPF